MTPPRDTLIFERELITPMRAVSALYGTGDTALARAIVTGLRHRIFEGAAPRPSNLVRRALGSFVFRLMQRTTRSEIRSGKGGEDVISYRNRILEDSQHPYAHTLLEPTRADTANFVEGGDPMNAVYMMLVPGIRKSAKLWDNIMFNSVQARDVQWRLVREARMVYKLAVRKLNEGRPVRIKSVAAGTGLCMTILVEQLLAEGHDPRLISATISDRETSNIEKSLCLLGKLPAAGANLALHTGSQHGIFLQIEDILRPTTKTAHDAPFDIVTVVGLLEYFPGHTLTTTEELQGQPRPEGPPDAADVIANVSTMTASGGSVVANSFRPCAAVRTMEVFGKRFRYRGREQMRQLMATGGLTPAGECVSANIFDMEVFQKRQQS